MPKSRRKRRSNNTSGYVGVTKLPGGGYQAQISIGNGKNKYLGSYDTAKQAAKAHDKEAIKLRRPFSKLNYPKKAPVGYTPIQQPLQSNNTVGYRGVSKYKKQFKATITIGSKRVHLGIYDTAKEAAIVYDRAVLKANKSTTLLNFPDMVHDLNVENSTKYKGVQLMKSGKFQASITILEQDRSIGTYDTALEAAKAYDHFAIKKGNERSTLNFPVGFSIHGTNKNCDGPGFYF